MAQPQTQPPQTGSFVPDQMPPDIKIIECSAAQADNRSEDNGTWTNILKQPITIRKGSELKVSQSFIDQRGIGDDIVQFETAIDSKNRDNTHTLLYQLQTCNDGYQNKTTSYDYIARAGGNASSTYKSNQALILIDAGQDYTAGNALTNTNLSNKISEGSGATITSADAYGANNRGSIRPKNISIISGGLGYKDKSDITFTPSNRSIGTGGLFGKINCDIYGTIKSITMTGNLRYNCTNTTPETVGGVISGSFTTEASITGTTTFNPYTDFEFINDTTTDATRGANYKRMDELYVEDPNNVGMSNENKAVFQVQQTYIQKNQLSYHQYFDQGYNYSSTPVLRWSPTFDVSEFSCYGEYVTGRNFISENFANISLPAPSTQINESMLSAGKIVRYKEDEFVSGIFHTNDSIKNQFQINKPILYLTGEDDDSSTFGLYPTVSGWRLIMDSDETDSGISSFPHSIFPIGSAVQFHFELVNGNDTASPEDLKALSDKFINPFSGIYQVSKFDAEGVMEFGTLNYEYIGEIFSYTDLTWNSTLQGTPISIITAPRPNETFDVPLILYGYPEDSDYPDFGFPSELPWISITTDGNGEVVSYDVVQGKNGKGLRVGMVLVINEFQYNTNDRWYIRQVDNSNGMMFGSSRNNKLESSDLYLAGDPNIPVSLSLIPQPYYMFNDDNRANCIGTQYKYGAVYKYAGMFPATFDNSFLRETSSIPSNDVISAWPNNGLYKNAGTKNYNDSNFNSNNSIFCNHSTEFQLTIKDDKIVDNIVDDTVLYTAVSLSTAVVWKTTPSADINTDFLAFYNNHVELQDYILTIKKSQWTASGYTQRQLPYQTYLILNEDTPEEQHLITGGIEEDTTGDFWLITVLVRDTQNNKYSRKIIGATQSNVNYMDTEDFPYVYCGFNVGAINQTAPTISLKFPWDNKNINNGILATWGRNDIQKGDLAVTSPQNFFNNNDVNKDYLIANTDAYNLPNTILNSYNNGGHYFLSNFIGNLSNNEGKAILPDLDYTDTPEFSQGLTNYLMGNLGSFNYSWMSPSVEYIQPTSFTDIEKIYAYEPLLRSKTFTIEKNFAIPSDIAGIWNLESHKLAGSLNPIEGGFYTPPESSGLLQNEFIQPVYGSNNPIGADGEYIFDFKLYPDSGGLEKGHCLGRNYIDSKQNWLSEDIILGLPEDENSYKYYNVYFRTSETFIRGYDPLAYITDGTSSKPDRTGIETVNLSMDKVGNVSTTNPTKTVRTLDGSAMGVSNAANFLYELGGTTDPAGNNPVLFSNEKTPYPIRYLDTDVGLYAKVSQYVGCDNPTLAYDQTISTFTFQYFHQPYTAPFVDGTGGDIGARVFYGNRRAGIYNHETLGGVQIKNYAMPVYNENIITYEESQDYKFPQYPNGLNPLVHTSNIGEQFLNKLGFTDFDIGSKNGTIDIVLGQVGTQSVEYEIDATLLVDESSVGFDYTYKSLNQTFFGTTKSDLDSSDAILSEVASPESIAGLQENNVTLIPQVGSKNTRVLKWGSYIFYPYGVENQTNSFAEKSNVRYDNASSVYGSIGGLMLSNAGRGMGLPNTVGSTFIVDSSSIPRTLNPDCNLYLSYSVVCESSLKKASLLPRKLTNGYLVLLSSLIHEPNFYMSSAGWVNAISVVSKAYITGDFILSQSEMSFYAKEDMVLSEITTEIKDTAFLTPSVLGENSTVVYQITNYNPQPEKQQNTIAQSQQIDYQVQAMVQEHLSKNSMGVPSPLDNLNNDIRSLGLDILGLHNKQTNDLVNAMSNQIKYHDLESLTGHERIEFLQSPEGEQLLQNTRDMMSVRDMTNEIGDVSDSIVNGGGNPAQLRQLQIQKRETEKLLQNTTDKLRSTIPSIFFRPSDPTQFQIPPLERIGDMNVKAVSEKDFKTSIPHRFENYKQYKNERLMGGRRPVSFQEYQQFHYNNVLQPPIGTNPLFDEATIPNAQEINFNLSPETIDRASQNPFLEAYKQSGQIMSENPEEDIDAFKDEVGRGVADLSHLQREILRQGGVDPSPVSRHIGSGRERIFDDQSKDLFNSTAHAELYNKEFDTAEARTDAESKISAFKESLKDGGKGRPSKTRKLEKQEIRENMNDFLSGLKRNVRDERKKVRLPIERDIGPERLRNEPQYAQAKQVVKDFNIGGGRKSEAGKEVYQASLDHIREREAQISHEQARENIRREIASQGGSKD